MFVLIEILNVCCFLQQIVNDPLMRNSAILVFANKQDQVGAKHAVILHNLEKKLLGD